MRICKKRNFRKDIIRLCYPLSPDDQLVAPKGVIPVYHLHGIRTNPDSIIITQEDYIELFRPNQYRQQKLSLTLKESVMATFPNGLQPIFIIIQKIVVQSF